MNYQKIARKFGTAKCKYMKVFIKYYDIYMRGNGDKYSTRFDSQTLDKITETEKINRSVQEPSKPYENL